MDESQDGASADEGGEPPTGYARSRWNATKHGLGARQTVLPWEEKSDYEALLAALVEEHRPVGPTQEHLVEELAGIVWRKRRLRLAEAASYLHGFRRMVDSSGYGDVVSYSAAAALRALGRPELPDYASVAEALHGDPDAHERRIQAYRATLEDADRALAELDKGGGEAYDRAIAELDEHFREKWEQKLEALLDAPGSGNIVVPDALAAWLRSHLKPAIEPRLTALTHREAIRAQAIGDAFNGERLHNIARYETHLDRRLERNLTVLVKLQELRRGRGEGGD